MTKDEFILLCNKADLGDIDAMKKAAFILMEMAEKKLKEGKFDDATYLKSKIEEYMKKIRAVN